MPLARENEAEPLPWVKDRQDLPKDPTRSQTPCPEIQAVGFGILYVVKSLCPCDSPSLAIETGKQSAFRVGDDGEILNPFHVESDSATLNRIGTGDFFESACVGRHPAHATHVPVEMYAVGSCLQRLNGSYAFSGEMNACHAGIPSPAVNLDRRFYGRDEIGDLYYHRESKMEPGSASGAFVLWIPFLPSS